MKHLTSFFLLFLVVLLSYGQVQPLTPAVLTNLESTPCELCLDVLKDGIDEELNLRKGTYYSQDLKTFFTSDRFLKEYHEGKWQGDVGLIIDGAPLDFGFGKSDKELQELQEKIRSATTIVTTSTFYETYRKVTKNTALAQIYVDCLVKLCKQDDQDGLRSLATSTNNTAIFIITYRDRGGRTARVKDFEIRSGLNKVTSITNKYKEGDNLLPEKKISCLRNPSEDLIMTLVTTAGDETIILESEDKRTSAESAFPLGTVIVSYLDFAQFNAVTNNNDINPLKIWSDAYSYWAPCDGRSVELSRLAKIMRPQNNVPDLRGIFVRGLNEFDPNEKTSVSVAQKDPWVTRKIGEFQKDALQNHKHEDEGHSHESDAITAGNTASDNNHDRDVTSLSKKAYINPGKAVIGPPMKITDSDTEVRTDEETRPKNVAMFHYIRIN